MIKKIEDNGYAIKKLFLGPLNQESLKNLLSEALIRKDVDELLELLEKKTGGNPFFLKH